jgi:hypothetical protein
MCASLRARLERRVNRVPATIRTTTLAELLAPPTSTDHVPPLPSVTSTKPPGPVQAKPKKAAAVAAPARTMRNAPAPATKKATTKMATTPPCNLPANLKAKKRTSGEISGDDDKENPTVMPKKRVRAAQGVKAATSAPTRTTRAASRSKPEQILSPKNANSRAKAAKAPAKTTHRPR